MPDMELSEAVGRIQPSATIAAATKAKELKARGVDVLEFTLGEPDFVTPRHIREAAKAAIDAGHTHYTPAGGTIEVKRAICDWYRRTYALEYEPAQCVVSNGAKHSIHNVLAALCGPGDEVVIPTPFWVSYADLVRLTGATPVLVPTTEAEGWVPTLAAVKQAMTPNTKLLMLNSPTNPTGAVFPEQTLRDLADLVVDAGILCLSDEIYEQLIYEGHAFHSFASLGTEVRERTITVSGVSKSYAMTGWRIGWALAPEPLARAMTKLQSQETSCPSAISQQATIAALEGPQDCVRQMRAEFAERRSFVLSRLRELPGVTFAEPGGAFYAFFNVSEYFGKPLGPEGVTVGNATEFCTAALEHAHVALVTGDAFGAPGYVRLSFAAGLETLRKGFDRLEAFLAGRPIE